MELLTYSSTAYLLNASLESLHAESCNWLKEIGFWRDEMVFFYKLLNKREFANTFPSKELAAIQNELIRIQSERLDGVKEKVESHEQALAALIKANSIQNEIGYREMHEKLLKEMHDSNSQIREFKKNVFAFAQKYG
jgi:hypothetical protein